MQRILWMDWGLKSSLRWHLRQKLLGHRQRLLSDVLFGAAFLSMFCLMSAAMASRCPCKLKLVLKKYLDTLEFQTFRID